MRILFAIKALDDIKGGAERVLTDIAGGLADRAHQISVLSYDAPGGQAFYELDRRVHRIPLGIGDVQSRARFSEVFRRMIAIRRAAQRLQPDVVIAFMHSTFIPTSLALIGTGVPVIASEHIVPVHYKNRFWEYILLHISRLFVKKITVLSDTIIQSYTRFLRKKMVAVANPVHAVSRLANPVGATDQQKIILNVGRFTAQKDQVTLIKAFAQIAPEYPDWCVRIIGDGEFQEKLEKAIQETGMEGRIFLPGPTNDIDAEYRAAHIFALPSSYESFGLATAEAMAHGLPALGFADCPGTNELIEHQENGLLVQGKNRVEDFRDGLKQLIDSDSLRLMLGVKAHDSVRKYHPDTIVEQWEDLIVRVVRKAKKKRAAKMDKANV